MMRKFVTKQNYLTINIPTSTEVESSFVQDNWSLPVIELAGGLSFENMLKGAGRVLGSLGGMAG